MKTATVSRNSFSQCFEALYYETTESKHLLIELFSERYGIIHWVQLDPDTVQLTYTDDEKMMYWMLRFS